MDRWKLFYNVRDNVCAYADFLRKNNVFEVSRWEDIPLTTKKNYLLSYPYEQVVRKNGMDDCFLIGASSGFSKTGSVYWLKGSSDEASYLDAVEASLKDIYSIDKKKTFIVVAAAFGMWIGGMQIACMMRSLAAQTNYPLTVALPGLDLEEAANVVKRFYKSFEQILFVTNASNVSIIYSLLKDEKNLLEGSIYFAVVGEYFSESYRRDIATKLGHNEKKENVLWTGYGSADVGDVGMETKNTIALRKYLAFEDKKLSKELFKIDDTPMIMAKSSKAFVEIVDGNIVVTKNQLIPLIRYNTNDKGGLLNRERLKGKIDDNLYKKLPEEMLYVFGRTENSVIFYGTNLMVQEIGGMLYSISDEISYSGLFSVEKKEKSGIESFNFIIYTFEDRVEKETFCKDRLIEFLKSSSKEFAAKYDNLNKAAGFELITVELRKVDKSVAAKKHRFIKESK